MKYVVAFIVTATLTFVVVTYIALESGGVITVYTVEHPSGKTRDTHIWYIKDEYGRLLLEAGSPENPWVQDLEHMESLRLEGEGLDGEYLFAIRGEESHESIRKQMRQKYGWRDWWISLVFDTTESYAIELTEHEVSSQL